MTDIVSKERLESIDAVELMKKVKTLNQYPYQVLLYGQDQSGLEKAVKPFIINTSLQPAQAKEYAEPATEGKVYFTNYDMVQMEMSKVAKASTVNLSNFRKKQMFSMNISEEDYLLSFSRDQRKVSHWLILPMFLMEMFQKKGKQTMLQIISEHSQTSFL